MKIGITEQGDAGIDFSWKDKLSTVDGAILITKKLSDRFIDTVLTVSQTTPIIVHCGCTGWGGTWLEPNVSTKETQLSYLHKLIQKGFPASNIVLRIDPIIPTEDGIQRACSVIQSAIDMGIPVSRIRISILDEYRHVKTRLSIMNRDSFYGNSFYAPKNMMDNVISNLSKYPFIFETCAEDMVASCSDKFIATGCVSAMDCSIMGLPAPDTSFQNGQNRNGCHCLGCKKELLSHKSQCPNGCVYCYWRNTVMENQK